MLAIGAIQSANKKSIQKSSALYEVPEPPVRCGMNSGVLRAKRQDNTHILKPTEEDAVVQYLRLGRVWIFATGCG